MGYETRLTATAGIPLPLQDKSPGTSSDQDYGPPGQVIHIPAGKSVYFEGDAADFYYRVEGGAVSGLRIFLNGARQMTALFTPGAYFGLANSGAHPYSADTICDSTLIRYRRDDLKNWMTARAERTEWLLQAVDRETAAVGLRSMIVGCRTPLERFATFLLMLMEKQPGTAVSGEIQLHLTREEIGDYLGLCMETVSRCVSRLRDRKVIDVPVPHRLVVLDRQALQALASEDLLDD